MANSVRDLEDEELSDEGPSTCDHCGGMLYHDCHGEVRCEECDPPCPHCDDGGSDAQGNG